MKVRPNEVYNLAAMSHVKVSFDIPEYTSQVCAIGTMNILNACKMYKMSAPVRYYQAGTSEMFGGSSEPLNELSKFNPKSPYACAKVFAHQKI